MESLSAFVCAYTQQIAIVSATQRQVDLVKLNIDYLCLLAIYHILPLCIFSASKAVCWN